jgi:hypothetical protein
MAHFNAKIDTETSTALAECAAVAVIGCDFS